MRNLYYVELKFGKFNMSICHTRATSHSKFIVSAVTPKEAKEITEKSIKLYLQSESSTPEAIKLNMFTLKATKIGLTNKKKGVMFSWMC